MSGAAIGTTRSKLPGDSDPEITTEDSNRVIRGGGWRNSVGCAVPHSPTPQSEAADVSRPERPTQRPTIAWLESGGSKFNADPTVFYVLRPWPACQAGESGSPALSSHET